MSDEKTLDVFVVARDRDIKLLRHFLLSYRLFCSIPGDIHVLIWRKDRPLLDQVGCPPNLIIHYKDDVPELVEDDFRNQMYLKLIADRYCKSRRIWAVDADYLICKPLTIGDLFELQRPLWYHCAWTDVTERSWRSASEAFLGQRISQLFMDGPLYILDRCILGALREKIDVGRILRGEACPSEFITYGAFAYSHFHDEYAWKNLEEDEFCLVYRVNQRPPSYCILDPNAQMSEIGGAKIVVFWSHWDLAERKMREFVVDAQNAAFGRVVAEPESQSLRLDVTEDEFREFGVGAWDGCYADGWVKREASFMFRAERKVVLEIDIDIPANSSGKPLLVCIEMANVRNTQELPSGIHTLRIPVHRTQQGTPVGIWFENGIGEPGGMGRQLYARVVSSRLAPEEGHRV